MFNIYSGSLLMTFWAFFKTLNVLTNNSLSKRICSGSSSTDTKSLLLAYFLELT